MQQLQGITVYADIGEVRMETRAAECHRLLAEGWILLGAYPLTTAGEGTPRKARKGQTEQKPEDSQQRVQRLVGYVVGKRRES